MHSSGRFETATDSGGSTTEGLLEGNAMISTSRLHILAAAVVQLSSNRTQAILERYRGESLDDLNI